MGIHSLDKNYDALDRLEKWDEVTQALIKKRIRDEVGSALSYLFLSDQEGETLEIICDILLPQLKDKNYIKISEAIDRDLASGKKGVRYGDDPWPQEFYKKGLAEIIIFAKKEFAEPVENMNFVQLNEMTERIMQRDPADFLRRFLRRVLADGVKIYYSHPKAWNEVGFPGPAYPEGYAYLDCDKKFDWEPKYE